MAREAAEQSMVLLINRNGTFVPRADHDGRPRFENEHGCHLYFRADKSEWQIADRFEPGRGTGALHPRITGCDGEPPVGAAAASGASATSL